MRMRAALGGFLVLLACAPLGKSGPVEGAALRKGQVAPPFAGRDYSVVFKGAERAVVKVKGNGKTYLGLYVYDEDGNCVAHDDLGDRSVVDSLVAEWYPARTGRFRIEVRNFGVGVNDQDGFPNIFQMDTR